MTELVDALKDARRPLFITHRQADRDSLGAAIGLQSLLDCGTVCTPDGIKKSARPLLAATGTEPVSDPDFSQFDTAVVVDAPSTDRIAPMEPEEPLLIDHHEPADLAEAAAAALVDTDADATSILVARLATEADWSLTAAAALPLLAGIFDDTDRLKTAGQETFYLTGSLLETLGPQVESFTDLLRHTPDHGEQTAETLGVLRATGYRSGEWFIAFSTVGGYESAAAEALRDAGVDLALVFSESSDGYRITARASEAFAGEVSLGDTLLPAVAKEFDGDGGGHSDAGGATVAVDDPTVIEAWVLKHLEQRFGTSFSAISGY